MGWIGSQRGIQGDLVPGGGEHVSGPAGAFVLPGEPEVERQADPHTTEDGEGLEPGAGENSRGEGVDRSVDFDLAAAPAEVVKPAAVTRLLLRR
ncbi:hypothetical protein OG554_05260 [Streptomyces griseus]|uniref:hypothetical protein n=1 Tax=Streptomyces griseus TaxID=1911 RepID=UPI00386BCA6B|nr:hypothetical protein OG554_05260 [Streptomyces fimicarius]